MAERRRSLRSSRPAPGFPDRPRRTVPAVATAAVSWDLRDLFQCLHSSGFTTSRYHTRPPPPAPRRLVKSPRC